MNELKVVVLTAIGTFLGIVLYALIGGETVGLFS